MVTGQHGLSGQPVVQLVEEEIKHKPEIVVAQLLLLVEKIAVLQMSILQCKPATANHAQLVP